MSTHERIRTMNWSSRSLSISLAAVVGLWTASVSAFAQSVPASGALLSAEDVRATYSSAGYEVSNPIIWEWTLPPVATVQIHDRSTGRVVMALVYRDAAAAEFARVQAQAQEVPSTA